MPDLNAEYPVPGNAEGSHEYPSDMLKQANELQGIKNRLTGKRRLVKKPGMSVASSDTKGPYKFATESESMQSVKNRLMRTGLRVKDSKYFRPPMAQAQPNTAVDGTMVKSSGPPQGSFTEDFTRHRLTILEDDRFPKYKIIKSQWKNQRRVKEKDGKGFLPGGWRGDPTSAMLNYSYGFDSPGFSSNS